MIMDSGLLIELVGERSDSKWAGNMSKVETLVEDDIRIIPGTLQIDWSNREKIYLFTESTAGEIKVEMEL